MVRSILDGRKNQTRRAMKLQPDIQPTVYFGQAAKLHAGESFKGGALAVWGGESEFDYCDCHCPYGGPGDRLWVKETFTEDFADGVAYRADNEPVPEIFGRWKPSIFMPRKLSRITLEITSVMVERLQDISRQDAKNEGVSWCCEELPQETFERLWNDINGEDAWAANPFVWVIEFRILAALNAIKANKTA